MSKISFIKSDNRKYNVSRCLSLLKSEIVLGIKNAKRIVVKPNCVVTDFQLAATHVDAIDAVMEFIAPYASSQIVLAEGTGIGNTMDAFKNYNYFSIQEKYGFTIVDLNQDDFVTHELYDKKGKRWKAQVAKTIAEADYVISLAPPKTHDSVVYTGAIKNVAVGSLLKPEINLAAKISGHFGINKNNKIMLHQGYKYQNINIAELAQKLPIHLAVIDGYSAMQGNGPGHDGEMVPAHWAAASSDALALDLFALKLMSINEEDVGYLNILKDEVKPDEPFVIGDDWRSAVLRFKLHNDYEKMKNWR